MRPGTQRWAWPLGVCSLLLVATLALSLLQGGDESSQETPAPTSNTTTPSATPAPTPTEAPSAPPTSSSSSASEPSSSAPPSKQIEDLEGREVGPEEVASSQGAVKVARHFTDLVEKHHGKDAARWWQDVKPLLSEMGVSQLQGRSADEVGFSRRTGKVRPLVTDVSIGDQFVAVSVPTDEGAYLFLLEEDGQNWKIASVSQLVEK